LSFTRDYSKIHTTKFDSISSEIIEEYMRNYRCFDFMDRAESLKLPRKYKTSSETAQSLVLQAKRENENRRTGRTEWRGYRF
jgi:hypothetical protein